MDQKEFMQKADEIVDSMCVEELKYCLHNIARKMPENKREKFLQLLDDACNQAEREDRAEIQYKTRLTDEAVKEKLAEIRAVFAKIEEGELCLYAEGYEDYSGGYWDSDWIWEYEDREGIDKIIVNAVCFAHDCVNDCRYPEALEVYRLAMDTRIPVEDESGGDSFELDLETVTVERALGINLHVLALEVLYSEYQIQPADKRADVLYAYFSYEYFHEVHIEEIFSVGREELKDTEIFWQTWIALLMRQEGEVAVRLLKEALLMHKGAEGLAEMARLGYREHPSLYLSALLEYEKSHAYEKMKELGKEALEQLEHDLKIRGTIAVKTAQAAWLADDRTLMRKCWYEAFCSDSSVVNYLRLFADREAVKEYKDLAEQKIDELKISDMNYHRYISPELEMNIVSSMGFRRLYFFSGHFDQVKDWCMEQKEPLGWSGQFIGNGINLLLLYLYAGSELKTAMKSIAASVLHTVGFNESKNPVFMKENAVFENEATLQKEEEVFWNIFCLWKKNYEMSEEDRRRYVLWLESVIDQRLHAVVGGKHQGTYGAVARLAAALGELKESLGMGGTKMNILYGYMKQYPRHRAFLGALREYM